MEINGSSAIITGGASGLGEGTARQLAAGGNLRIVVNCAGTGWVGRVINRDGSPHELGVFQFIQTLNVIGTFNVMTRAASAMATIEPQADGERGVIVNTASVAAFEGQIGPLCQVAPPCGGG